MDPRIKMMNYCLRRCKEHDEWAYLVTDTTTPSDHTNNLAATAEDLLHRNSGDEASGVPIELDFSDGACNQRTGKRKHT